VFSFSRARIFLRPDEDVNEMLVALVNQRGHGAAVQIIQSPTDERKILCREILRVRRKINFAVEPRLDGVLVGRQDIGQMICLKRSDVTGDGIVEQLVVAGNSSGPQKN